jgi:hypothetical protein
MANKPMKRCSKSFVNGEMPIKTTRIPLTSALKDITKKNYQKENVGEASVDEDMEELQTIQRNQKLYC